MRILPPLLLVLMLISSTLHSQEASSPGGPEGANQPDWIQSDGTVPEGTKDWVQPESPGDGIEPVGEQAITVLRAEAYTVSIDAKARVLSALQQLSDEGRLSPRDENAIGLLAFLATESYDFQMRREGRVINDFPMIRADAVRLLGSVGGTAASVVLQRVLTHEEDAYVLSHAVRAVARTTPQPTPELLSTLTSLVNRMTAVQRPDNALAMSVIRAVEELHDNSGGIDDPDLFRALISIAQGGYSTTVRREAVRVIDKLRQRER